MKNIDYALSGYDFYFGNPTPAKAPAPPIDPGFRQNIFKAVYDGSTTDDGRYCRPCKFIYILFPSNHIERFKNYFQMEWNWA